jgi:peroxiredoxin
MLAAVRFRTLATALAVLVALACSQEPEAPAAAREPAPANSPTVASAAAAEKPAPPQRERQERPLPAISGWTVDDQRFDVSSLLGKRLMLFFFNPEIREAAVVADSVAAVSPLRGKHNFQIYGIATGASRPKAVEFAKQHHLDFPIVDDSNAAITNKLGLRLPVALLGVDAEGYVTYGMGQFATEEPDAEAAIETQIREALRLPARGDAVEPGPGEEPLAPNFKVGLLDSDKTFELAAQRGKAVVLLFFLHTCPHCHELLGFLKETLPAIPEDKRPFLIGIEISGRPDSVREQLKNDGLDFFPVAFDLDGKIRAAYGVFAGVPDTFLIDGEGRIRERVRGWVSTQHGPLLRMRLAKLGGAPVPMLLRTQGYSGSEVCGVCHAQEYETWTFTKHATAFDTLVTHGSDADPECVGCHVVGYNESGGFTSITATPDLEHVGCESCHGRGGPHLSPGFVKEGNYETACARCHDQKHSLGFEYAKFMPRISHAANAYISKLPAEEKRKLLAARGAPRKDLLPTSAAYVGSEACKSCHASEHATWAASLHARAIESLEARKADTRQECLRCHVTAYGKPGGFPEGAAAAQHHDRVGVGCESCHGPGSDHVAPGAKKIGTIVSLGDKCDSCVILQICGVCHDDANDSGFEFEVKAKIEKQRHGTIEAGTGKAKPTGAALERPRAVEELLADAFARRDAGI